MRRMKRILPCLLAVLLLLSGCGMPKAEEPKTTAVTSAEPEDYTIAEPWTDTATDFRGVLEKYYSAEELGVEDGIYAEIRLWPLRSSLKAGLKEWGEIVRLPDGMTPDDLYPDDLVEVLCAENARDEHGHIHADEIRTIGQSPAHTEWAVGTRYGILYNVTPYLPPEPEDQVIHLFDTFGLVECPVNVGEGNIPQQDGERNFEPEGSYWSYGVLTPVFIDREIYYFSKRPFYEFMANGRPTGRMIADESYFEPDPDEIVPGEVIWTLNDVEDTVRNVAVCIAAFNGTAEPVDLAAIHAVSLEHEENGAWVQMPADWVCNASARNGRERVAPAHDFEFVTYYIEPEDPTLMMTGKFRLTLENGESFEFVLMNECFVDRRLGQ